MRHWPEDLSDVELALGVASPWLTQSDKDELIFEMNHRKFEREVELAELS